MDLNSSSDSTLDTNKQSPKLYMQDSTALLKYVRKQLIPCFQIPCLDSNAIVMIKYKHMKTVKVMEKPRWSRKYLILVSIIHN